MEATYGCLVLWSTALVISRIERGTLTKLDLYFFITPFLLMGLSALFAWANYGQPIVLGIGEERRSLSFLMWFLYDPIRRSFKLDFAAQCRAFVWCAAVYLVLGLLVQVLAPGSLLARDIPDLDVRKLRITSPGECFSFCFLLGVTWFAISGSRAYAIAASVGLAGLLLIAQTRQITIIVLLFAITGLMFLRPVQILKFGAAGAIAGTAILMAFNLDPITPLVELIAPNAVELDLSQNPRGATIEITMNLLMDNLLVGLGNVSVLHDGGLFQRLYGKHFWVNDVGPIGEIFRLGFLWFAFAMAAFIVFYNTWAQIPDRTNRMIIAILMLYFMVQGVSVGYFYGRGSTQAFLLLLGSAAIAAPRPHRHTVAAPAAVPDRLGPTGIGL